MTKPNKMTAIYLAFTREGNASMNNFFATVLIFFIVIYLQGFRVQIPLIHQKHRGYNASFKIKLFYTSNMSVILQSMIVSQIHQISRILSDRFSKSILVKIFGVW
jgi:protein transport protein SEC61 subunit alpha